MQAVAVIRSLYNRHRSQKTLKKNNKTEQEAETAESIIITIHHSLAADA
jgi:hypothetical protein